MIDEGKPLEAEQVLEKALEYSDILEDEVTPELEERVEESSMQIQYVLKEIEEQVSGSEWDDVKEKFDENFEKEGKIRTAAGIAAKINELCAELAELDPIQYEDTCKARDDAPKWMRDKHKEWTEEQKAEAKKFGEIITECFQTSGRDCRCEDISFYDFSVFCEKMSELAVECDEGNDNACMEMEEEEMPELPEHLEDIFFEMEDKFGEAKFEKHMPEECRRERATPKECMLIMAEFHAPPECRVAIKEAIKSGKIRSERGARDICDKIMFKMHAPQECIDAGIKTPEACAALMMPQECIDAGLTGEHRSDEMKCKELMKKGRYYGGGGCIGIGSIEERLTCLEGAVRGMDDMYYRPEYDDREMPDGEMTWQCKENRIHWPPDCERFMREEWPRMQEQRDKEYERNVMEREDYNMYRDQYHVDDGRQLCPDGICDDWERNSGGCFEDCGHVEPGLSGGMDCGPGCYFDFYFNVCECPVMMDCGPGCWSEGNTCVCSSVGGTDCGPGCWWEYDHCKCAGCTCPDGSWSENCQCGAMTGCWCGNWWSDTCDCGIVSGGCQCSWGWSDVCDCGAGGVTDCSPGCWWEYDHCECGDRVACSPGCWWDDYYKSCQCSAVETCPSNSYTTQYGACDYSMCPSGCNFNYQGCPDSCMSAGGCTCGDGYYSDTCDCTGHEAGYGCQCSWGWSDTCQCGTTGGTCSSMGGTCCSVCAGGSYISGTECNCCMICQGDTCPSNSYTSNAGACDYSMCPNGCTFDSSGCPSGCMTTGGYCGDGSCNVGETPAGCPSDCGGDVGCPDNSWTTNAGACDYSICPNGCNFDNQGCPSGCMTSSGGCVSDSECGTGYYCGASGTCMPEATTGYCGDMICNAGEETSCPSDCGTTSGCTCADGYWSENCDCSGHEYVEDVCAGCDCSGCGDGECIGTDGNVCCTFSPCEPIS